MTEWKIHRPSKSKLKCTKCGRTLDKEGHGHINTWYFPDGSTKKFKIENNKVIIE